MFKRSVSNKGGVEDSETFLTKGFLPSYSVAEEGEVGENDVVPGG